jgi:hypothetical protein
MADEALVALKAREAELAREWQWLVNALHIIAAVRACSLSRMMLAKRMGVETTISSPVLLTTSGCEKA